MRKFKVHWNGGQKVVFQSRTAMKCRGSVSSPLQTLRSHSCKRQEGSTASAFALGELMPPDSYAERPWRKASTPFICGPEWSR